MIHAGMILLILGGVLWGIALFVFCVENERLPGTHRRWSAEQRATTYGKPKPGISVGVRRKSEFVEVAFIPASNEQFEALLSEAITEARLKAMALNDEHRHARRRLPR